MWNRVFISILLSLSMIQGSIAQSPTPFPSPVGVQNTFSFGAGGGSGREQDTSLLLNQQSRDAEGGQNSLSLQDNIQLGRERANQMVEMLKTEEMQHALQKVTKKGKQALQENPSLRNPLGIIAGAVGLWVGNSVRLIRGDSFNLSTRIEGRNRASEFSMESPLLNGKLRFSANDGVAIHMNRRISSIGSQAEINYNVRDQSFSTSIRQRIAPNLDFSFGASQIPQSTTTDGNARIEYRFNF